MTRTNVLILASGFQGPLIESVKQSEGNEIARLHSILKVDEEDVEKTIKKARRGKNII